MPKENKKLYVETDDGKLQEVGSVVEKPAEPEKSKLEAIGEGMSALGKIMILLVIMGCIIACLVFWFSA